MTTKLEEIQVSAAELRKSLAELDALMAALEKPKQWEPRGGYYRSIHNTERSTVAADAKAVAADAKARCAMKSHNRLLAYVDEFGGDWEADWDDHDQTKFYICYTTWVGPSHWSREKTIHSCVGGTVYMSKDCADGLIAKLESGEVLL
jgi:hypothetical protein